MAAAVFLQRLGVDLKRRVFPRVPLDDAEDIRGDVLGFLPVLLVPLLENADRRTCDLDVELNALSEAGEGEVGRADKSCRAGDFQAGAGEIALGVEFVFFVD